MMFRSDCRQRTKDDPSPGFDFLYPACTEAELEGKALLCRGAELWFYPQMGRGVLAHRF
jgi:hypothetical protein